MGKNIAVLLTVYNRKEKTLRCLHNLFSQKSPKGYNLKVYLTDGGSTDGTVEDIQKSFPQVNIEVHEGLFWNRGMYTSWNKAACDYDYDYYLWLNDDTFLYENALIQIIDATQRHGENTIIIGATVDTKTHSILTYGGRIHGKIAPCAGTDTEVSHFNGNIILIPKQVYHQLGNLDFYFTHSKGDFDYGMRAQKKGIKMYQCGVPLGECDAHYTLDRWCNPAVPFAQRWKALRCPNGMPPKETFHLEHRHYGLFPACLHYLTIYVRCLFPVLWEFKRNN